MAEREREPEIPEIPKSQTASLPQLQYRNYRHRLAKQKLAVVAILTAVSTQK